MMKIIIVPVDFSQVSLNAARYAVHMAVSLDAYIILLHVFADREQENESVAGLKSLKDELLQLSKGRIKIATESRQGNAWEEGESFCREIGPFAVIMGVSRDEIPGNGCYGNIPVALLYDKWMLIAVPPSVSWTGKIKCTAFAMDFNRLSELPADAAFLIDTVSNAFHSGVMIMDTGLRGSGEPEHSGLEISLLRQDLEHLRPVYGHISGIFPGERPGGEPANCEPGLVILMPVGDGNFCPCRRDLRMENAS